MLKRRLAGIEKIINPDPKDGPPARICIYASADLSQTKAIRQHFEKYGRMPVLVIPEKGPMDL